MFVAEYNPELPRTVVLLHGGGVAGWMWEPVRAELGDEYRLIAPDLPGHDRSANEDYVSHEQTLEQLRVMLAERTSSPVAVAGFSLGAQLALALASETPELVSGIVSISALAIPSRAPGFTRALLSSTAGLARNERFARAQAKVLGVPPALVPDYLRTSDSLSKATLLNVVAANGAFVPPPGWARFADAAIVLAGGREPRPVQRSARLLQTANPHCSLELDPDAGHTLPFSNPTLVARSIRAVTIGGRGETECYPKLPQFPPRPRGPLGGRWRGRSRSPQPPCSYGEM